MTCGNVMPSGARRKVILMFTRVPSCQCIRSLGRVHTDNTSYWKHTIGSRTWTAELFVRTGTPRRDSIVPLEGRESVTYVRSPQAWFLTSFLRLRWSRLGGTRRRSDMVASWLGDLFSLRRHFHGDRRLEPLRDILLLIRCRKHLGHYNRGVSPRRMATGRGPLPRNPLRSGTGSLSGV